MPVATSTTPPVARNLDYRCLNLCIGQHNSSQECLQQCSYGPTIAPAQGKPAILGHNQFSALSTPDNDPLLKPAAKPVKAGKEDYRCYTQCEQSGEQLALCQQKCTSKPDRGLTIPLKGNTPP